MIGSDTRRLSTPCPRLSIVVRSYNRLGALAELLAALLAQDHDSFEIVVVEQSTVRPTAEAARIDQLAADPRVRLLRFPPLGGTVARNTGVEASRGEIIALIDDDDLPADDRWLRDLERNFADPRCLAVTGRQIVSDGKQPPYRNMRRARANVMSYSWLMWQRCYTQIDQRSERVTGIHGTNAAIRRSTVERFGLWDTCCEIEDENSLCFRILRSKHSDEYLAFDPLARIIRRTEVPGGLNKRGMTTLTFGRRMFTYFHNIIGHYHRARFALLYPAYMALLWYLVCERIFDGEAWKYAGRPIRKALAVSCVTLAFPAMWLYWFGAWARGRGASSPPERGRKLAVADRTVRDAPRRELSAVA